MYEQARRTAPVPDGGVDAPAPTTAPTTAAPVVDNEAQDQDVVGNSALQPAAPETGTSTPNIDALIAEHGQEMVGVIPEGASVTQDGATYRYRDGQWTLNGEPVADFEVWNGGFVNGGTAWEGASERNAGAQWLEDTIGFYDDDVSTGWCGTTSWQAVTRAYLESTGFEEGSEDWAAAYQAMRKMGLGMASPERIMTTFGPGAAFGHGETWLQGQFHAWNPETQGQGNWYSRFFEEEAEIPQTAQEAISQLQPGNVLVTDHKDDDFAGDNRSRVSDHIIAVEDTWVSTENPNIVTFTSFEGNAGSGLVDGEMSTDNMVPVNKEYMLVPQDRDGDGVTEAWGAYSVTLPLNIDGEEKPFTISQLIEAGYVHVDEDTTPQDIMDQVDQAIETGGFTKEAEDPLHEGEEVEPTERVSIAGWKDSEYVKSRYRNGITTDLIDGRLDFSLTTREAYLGESLAGVGGETPLDRSAKYTRPAEVGMIQDLLVELDYMAKPGQDRGWFGSKTDAAVKAFQEAHGLAPTGAVDDATRDALIQAASHPEEAPAEEQAPAPTTTPPPSAET